MYAYPGFPPPYYPPPGYPAAPYPYPYAPVPFPQPYAEPAFLLARQVRGARWAAAAIDATVVIVSWIVLSVFAFPTVTAAVGWPFAPLAGLALGAAWLYLYYAVLDGFAGGTVGKRAMGLALVNRELQRITYTAGLQRALEAFVWPFGIFIVTMIVFIYVQTSMVDKHGQGMGDRIAETYLVRRAQLQQAAPAAY